jgi:protein-L-isoaspartate(D-aspartate) O-methyltransferase
MKLKGELMKDFTALRRRMVNTQLVARGVRDPDVLEAMSTVPREAFVPADQVQFAYADSPLPIGQGQTISQPYIVAWMTEALDLALDERVLEIGTGSGYAAAVLSRIATEVYTVERHLKLARAAEARFQRLGYDNIHVHVGDGTLGWVEHAPYDAIVVTAGGPEVPDPLLEQLAEGGRLVIPVGQTLNQQELVRVHRSHEDGYVHESLGAVRFVPLVGKAGWQEPGWESGSAWDSGDRWFHRRCSAAHSSQL